MMASKLGQGYLVEQLLRTGVSQSCVTRTNPHTCLCHVTKARVWVCSCHSRQDGNGWTVLMTASRYGHGSVAEVLLRKGASVDLRQKNGTALMFASANSHQPISAMLQAHAAKKQGKGEL